MKAELRKFTSTITFSLLVIFAYLIVTDVFNGLNVSATAVILFLFVLSFLIELFKRRSFRSKEMFEKNLQPFMLASCLHIALMLFFSYELRVYAAAIIILDAVTLALYAALHGATRSAKSYFLLIGISFATLLVLNPVIISTAPIIDLDSASGFIGLFGAIVVVGLSLELFLTLRKFSSKVEALGRARSSNMFFTASFGLVSHNIRTPLTSIQNQLSILKLQRNHDTNKFIQSFDLKVKSMEESMGTIDELVSSLISNYKDQIDFISSQDKTLLSWWTQMKDRFDTAIFGELHLAPLSKRYDSELFVLTLALQAFVDNAEKHAKSNVHVFSNKESIFIQDRGPGFNAEIIEKIGKDIIKSKIGSGLGLFLVYQLLASNQWHMSISNNETGGLIKISPL